MSSLASCRARSKFQECGVHGEQQRARQVPADSKAAGTRPPAVAGLFYPRDPVRLQEDVLELLGGVALASKVMPKALIAPHAGYSYSGRVAGASFAKLRANAQTITRVVVSVRVLVRRVKNGTPQVFCSAGSRSTTSAARQLFVFHCLLVSVKRDRHRIEKVQG